MEASYGLSCDNCGNYFTSIEAFPKPHLCPRCLIVYKAGQDSMLKEVKEWMDENCLGCRSNTPCNTDEYLGFHKESWQAFLKGLEGDKK